MSSKVYFTNFRTSTNISILSKLNKLLYTAGITNLDCKDKFTAIKSILENPAIYHI